MWMLDNHTPYAAERSWTRDARGVHLWIVAVRATFDLVWLSGWAPHESQQKPLPRGSAKMRLADALGVREQTGED